MPPRLYIFSLQHCQRFIHQACRRTDSYLAPTLVRSVLTKARPRAFGEPLMAACSAKAEAHHQLLRIGSKNQWLASHTFSKPAILPFIGTHHYYKILSGRII